MSNKLSPDLKKERRALRTKLLGDKLLGETDTLNFKFTFDGYGDSGNCNNDSGNKAVDAFFTKIVESCVTFDWYNNDGGGGTITWDVRADKLLVNGYQNETVATTVMDEVEV